MYYGFFISLLELNDEKMKNGLSTCLYKELDKAGVEISGGEAQKIVIARALYKNAPFIILDEPTAALDPIAESEISAESGRTSADIKKAIARREREDANRMDLGNVEKTIISDATSMEDTQDAVNSEITNILNRLSLLSNDIKGTSIDSQI